MHLPCDDPSLLSDQGQLLRLPKAVCELCFPVWRSRFQLPFSPKTLGHVALYSPHYPYLPF